MTRINKLQNNVRETAYALAALINSAKEIDPVAASGMMKEVLQYLRERTEVPQTFTLGELEKLGYLPKVN